jgi:hypothetical protein
LQDKSLAFSYHVVTRVVRVNGAGRSVRQEAKNEAAISTETKGKGLDGHEKE